MKMGEVDLISAPAAWAYGADGFGAEGKPVASDVHVELELVDFVRAKEPYELELPAKLRLQETRKEQGNAHFKRGGLERALQLYQRSLTVVQESDLSDARGGRQGDIRRYREISDARGGRSEAQIAARISLYLPVSPCISLNLPVSGRSEAQIAADTAASTKVKLACHLNSAQCHLKLADLPAAVKACDAALLLEPASLKAHLRRGQARLRMGDLDEAKADLTAAAKLDPKSREVRVELEELKVKLGAQRAKEKNTFGGMFK